MGCLRIEPLPSSKGRVKRVRSCLGGAACPAARGEPTRAAAPVLMGVQVADEAVIADLAPTGVLRASINLGNPVLAQGTGQAPAGVTVDLSREIAARLGVPRR